MKTTQESAKRKAESGNGEPESWDRPRAEAELKQIAHLVGLLGCSVALRDQEVLALNAKHQPLIDSLQRDIAERQTRLELWARANRESEFGEAKTLKMPDGELAFRKGQRKLELLPEGNPVDGGAWGWDEVLSKLLSFEETSQWCEFVKWEPSIDKRMLLIKTDGEPPEFPPARLKTIGLQVTREERFTVTAQPGPGAFEVAP